MRGPVVVRGFTLIEVMVTLTLLGLLVAVVFPNMSRWYDGVQRRQALAQLHRQLQQLPAVAVFTGRDLSLTDVIGAQITVPQRYRVSLPPGWFLIDAGEMRFLRTGLCRTGSATLATGTPQVKAYVQLRSVMCEVTLGEQTVAASP